MSDPRKPSSKAFSKKKQDASSLQEQFNLQEAALEMINIALNHVEQSLGDNNLREADASLTNIFSLLTNLKEEQIQIHLDEKIKLPSQKKVFDEINSAIFALSKKYNTALQTYENKITENEKEEKRKQEEENKKQLEAKETKRKDLEIKLNVESKRVEEVITSNRMKGFEPILLEAFKIIPPEKKRRFHEKASSAKRLTPDQAKKMSEDQKTLSYLYARLSTPGEITTLTSDSLSKLAPKIDKLRDHDEQKIAKYKERREKLLQVDWQLYQILYQVIPLEGHRFQGKYQLNKEIMQSNDLVAITEEYMRVYDAVTQHDSPPELPMLPVSSEAFRKLWDQHRVLEDKVKNREEHLRFYEFRVSLRNLFHALTTKKINLSPQFIPQTAFSSESSNTFNFFKSSSSGVSVDSPSITHERKVIFLPSSPTSPGPTKNSPPLRIQTNVTDLAELDKKKSKRQKRKEQAEFKKLHSTLYTTFDLKTLGIIKKRRDKLMQGEKISHGTFSPSHKKQNLNVQELQFYNSLITSYDLDDSKDKSVKKHFDQTLAQPELKEFRQNVMDVTENDSAMKTFFNILSRVDHIGSYPSAPTKSHSPVEVKNQTPKKSR